MDLRLGIGLTTPEECLLLPPGDAALTHRVKAAGYHLFVQKDLPLLSSLLKWKLIPRKWAGRENWAAQLPLDLSNNKAYQARLCCNFTEHQRQVHEVAGLRQMANLGQGKAL